jgi:mono/diheme cytochrome c family protein
MGRTVRKSLLVAAVFVVIAVGVVLGYYYGALPAVGEAPDINVSKTPERLERGKYLAMHVTGCIDCHSKRDFNMFSGPVIPGTEGMGGEEFNKGIDGIPGTLFARNITPAGLGNMSDGELVQAIACGIAQDGRVMFPLMPYKGFEMMSEEDLFSIITYVRSLSPIENDVPTSTVDFPVSMFIRSLPAPYSAKPSPDRSKSYEYGNYLVTIAGCGHCHTPAKEGTPVAGMEFAGGREFNMPNAVIRSANITPDEESGIGLWTKEMFIERFESHATEEMKAMTPEEMGYQTVMPWTLYAGMTRGDLGAIYDHLRTMTPVSNEVERFTEKGPSEY